MDYLEFNPAETMHRLDDDLEFLREMVDMFPEQTSDGLQRLESALQRQDLNELKEAAHRFKGSVAILSTGRLYQMLRQIETADEGARGQTAALLLPEIPSAIEALSRELNDFLQRERAAGPHASEVQVGP